MWEKDIIFSLKSLKKIKPRQEWVVFAKEELFRTENKAVSPAKSGERLSMILDIFPRFVHHLNYRYAFAALVFIFFITSSAFIYAQNALPGDLLFTLKKSTEKARTFLAPESEVSQYKLEITNQRLDELAKIVESKQGKKLAPAIKEFQASAREAALNIKNIKNVNRNIVLQAKKIEEAKEKMEALGVVIGDTAELDSALANLVEMEIKDLKNKTLTEEQKSELASAEKDFQDKNYNSALEKILSLTQEQGAFFSQ